MTGTLLSTDIPTSYTPGDVTAPTGGFRIFVDTIELGAAETLTVEGTGTVMILG